MEVTAVLKRMVSAGFIQLTFWQKLEEGEVVSYMAI